MLTVQPAEAGFSIARNLPDPTATAVPALHDRCEAIMEWAQQTDDIEQLNEARQWVSAVEKYLEQKHAQGPAMRAARFLEARIGELLGKASPNGKGLGSVRADPSVLTRHERHEFRKLAEHKDLWEHNPERPRKRILREIRDDEADMRPIVERPVEILTDIRQGDFRTVLADIPDGSVDLILTDPPYPGEFLPLWSDLAIFAKRVLSPSGVLAAMSGQVHLPEIYARLGEHLTYRWTMAYLMGGAANVVHARRVSTMWKPVLVYGSTDRRLHDVATSKAADKEYHGWGQSESGTYDLLRLLADPGSVVCDPFLGGGTTAVVATAHGCHFIGAELDPESYERARKRANA